MSTPQEIKSNLLSKLRQYPDFPTKGVLFEDIMPIFRDPKAFQQLIDGFKLHLADSTNDINEIDAIIGLDARGFLFGPTLALQLGVPFIPVRKQGKLPGETVQVSYQKEYAADVFEIQADCLPKPGAKVVIVDDIIATGGSAMAAGQLVEKLGGVVSEYWFLLELDFLKGREKLNAPVFTLLSGQTEKLSS